MYLCCFICFFGFMLVVIFQYINSPYFSVLAKQVTIFSYQKSHKKDEDGSPSHSVPNKSRARFISSSAESTPLSHPYRSTFR
ncbi:hypothetical protein M501DRAFT_591510 [Patellaria atrata CBS 101060]|uniref:Uncharacterized protein n=1 Tax=Patellaria atrata CBS 101060 TaxID=1346257 RepID=A0A9P4VKF7_9PEZI|nr:hypothetical protein M501DRAFT_591510 [Patellaria atrata CBS 101060]